MKVLVFGSDGFIGRNVCSELENNHEVTKATRYATVDGNSVQVDLLDQDSVGRALKSVHPEVIINCAGIVDVSLDTDLNIAFTKNILEQASKLGGIKKIIISGSAGEYGKVNPDNIPVGEDAPLNADSGYGLSKSQEEQFALEYGKKNNINVVVVRIFNPIGQNMAERFLLMRLLNQVWEFKLGKREVIEVARLDAKRDYVSVKDIATAIRSIIEGDNKESVYNIGSGQSTTNGELLEIILKNSKLEARPNIVETSSEPESLVAVQADISRISNEFKWSPIHTIDEVVSEIYLS